MLGEIFYWILSMSIAALICALPVVLLRLIKRIPRRAICLLWAIPLIRMCVPVGITSRYSLMSLLSHFTTRSVMVREISEDLSFTCMNHVMIAENYFPITYKTNLLESVFSASSVIWITVAAAIVIAFFIVYATTMREIRHAVPYESGVFMSEKVQIPAVYGILRPRILLPSTAKEAEIPYILRHERAHIRRGDNLFRTLAFILTAVHWFNPLSWLFLKLILADMEIACDEAVLARLSESERKEYAHTLLCSVEKATVFLSPFGGASIRTRIENILSYKKLSVLSVLAFAALVITAAYVLLTNAV